MAFRDQLYSIRQECINCLTQIRNVGVFDGQGLREDDLSKIISQLDCIINVLPLDNLHELFIQQKGFHAGYLKALKDTSSRLDD